VAESRGTVPQPVAFHCRIMPCRSENHQTGGLGYEPGEFAGQIPILPAINPRSPATPQSSASLSGLTDD
jgi:hypothetical protein